MTDSPVPLEFEQIKDMALNLIEDCDWIIEIHPLKSATEPATVGEIIGNKEASAIEKKMDQQYLNALLSSFKETLIKSLDTELQSCMPALGYLGTEKIKVLLQAMIKETCWRGQIKQDDGEMYECIVVGSDEAPDEEFIRQLEQLKIGEE